MLILYNEKKKKRYFLRIRGIIQIVIIHCYSSFIDQVFIFTEQAKWNAILYKEISIAKNRAYLENLAFGPAISPRWLLSLYLFSMYFVLLNVAQLLAAALTNHWHCYLSSGSSPLEL